MKILALSIFALWLAASPVHAEVIELENGDRFEAKIMKEDEDALLIDHPIFGEMVIPRSALKKSSFVPTVVPEPVPEPEPEPEPEPDPTSESDLGLDPQPVPESDLGLDPPPPPEKPGIFGTAFLRGWSRSVGAGISGSQGNSKDASFNLSASLKREAETFRSIFGSAYFYATTRGEESSNEAYADYRHDFLFEDSKFYLFINGRYDYDEFQSWKHRISGSSGAGYEILERDTLDLSGRLGVGLAKTWGIENELNPEGVLGIALEWRVQESQTFNADTAIFPDLGDFSKYRVVSNATYRISIGQWEGLSLKLGVKSEFNSSVPGKKHDLNYYGSLVYDF